MKKLEQIRQGDVLLVAVEKIPPRETLAKNEVILAEGEITGHTHRLIATQILEWEEKGQRYIRVMGDEAGKLFHEEHDPTAVAVVMPEITYRVISQQEWNLESQWNKVQD